MKMYFYFFPLLLRGWLDDIWWNQVDWSVNWKVKVIKNKITPQKKNVKKKKLMIMDKVNDNGKMMDKA